MRRLPRPSGLGFQNIYNKAQSVTNQLMLALIPDSRLTGPLPFVRLVAVTFLPVLEMLSSHTFGLDYKVNALPFSRPVLRPVSVD